jgi:hypothetical protein
VRRGGRGRGHVAQLTVVRSKAHHHHRLQIPAKGITLTLAVDAVGTTISRDAEPFACPALTLTALGRPIQHLPLLVLVLVLFVLVFVLVLLAVFLVLVP